MPNLNQRIPPSKMPGSPLPRGSLPRMLPAPQTGEGERERIPPEIQAKVWRKRFGFRSTGTCVCCHESAICRDDFVCGHRRAYAGGSTDVSNLEPICARCSRLMGTQDLVSWCKKFQQKLKVEKTMPKTTAKKTVKKATAKKTAKKAAAKKTVRRATAKKGKK